MLKKIRNAMNFLIHDRRRFVVAVIENLLFFLSDEVYLKLLYRAKMGVPLILDAPKGFNQKLQWLKLYHRKPILTTMVDKLGAKKYVANLIGDQYIIPTLNVWDDVSDIDLDTLPNQFVLKTTNGGGNLDVLICKDKSKADLNAIKMKFDKSLKRDLYRRYREWPYKNVSRKIFAESYIEEDDGGLIDYKFFCFNGDVDCVMVCVDRHLNDTKFYFFDKEWKLKRLNLRGKAAPENFTLRKPACIDEMFDVASKISMGLPFVRVDLYEVKGHVYFGEMTFFPDGGFDPNLLAETDAYFGEKIVLPK